MHGAVFGEFLGTMVLLLFGNGVVANVLLDRSKGKDSGWIVITAGWGFAVFCGIVVSLGVGGVAQLNPAVTLAGAIVSGDYSHVVPYVAAQMAGAVVSGVLVWLVYLPHWATSDPDSKLAAFCTQPAIRAPAHNVLSELIGTVMLIVIGMALAAKGFVAGGLAPGMGPFFWGILVWALGLSLGGQTGYAINPARDLGPRIAHAILPIAGKRDSDWGYAWVPVLGPLAGGVVGAVIVKATGIA
ncbi:MIP/aquaporin family protein [Novosphingobium sp. Fuku2-ISO-50]|uniref:MIP/aquaporin family protein n=1 Tax=Novosphingobium sp. Fuku2-ISO-50 TaxID=1739114 RepID=UPI00076D1101|nr:MIP/aquaporin family protein [Novosphingobium sp. Fuku2-ISO-50]KUR76177.1 glycerol transporter [Novosphingobium sp. Fuku2-ISO-50]